VVWKGHQCCQGQAHLVPGLGLEPQWVLSGTKPSEPLWCAELPAAPQHVDKFSTRHVDECIPTRWNKFPRDDSRPHVWGSNHAALRPQVEIVSAAEGPRVRAHKGVRCCFPLWDRYDERVWASFWSCLGRATFSMRGRQVQNSLLLNFSPPWLPILWVFPSVFLMKNILLLGNNLAML
jgi:hypothetical protein